MWIYNYLLIVYSTYILNQKVIKPASKQESFNIQTRSHATRWREWNKFLSYIKNNKIEQSWIKLLY